jgi:hypothetical protein
LLPHEPPPPFFVLDNGLNPHIARAMASLGYRIRSVQDEFEDPTGAVEDPDIIHHISRTYGFHGVWITKDTSAKRAHLELIKARRISVVWVQKQVLSTQQQHRIIAFGFARVHQDLLESKHPIHYLVTFHGCENRERITYRVEWAPHK